MTINQLPDEAAEHQALNAQALDAVLGIVDPDNQVDYIGMRARNGDVYTGARAVGLSEEEAREVANDTVTNPALRDQIASSGLLAGARQGLEWRRLHG